MGSTPSSGTLIFRKSLETEEICDFRGFLKSRLCNGVQRKTRKRENSPSTVYAVYSGKARRGLVSTLLGLPSIIASISRSNLPQINERSLILPVVHLEPDAIRQNDIYCPGSRRRVGAVANCRVSPRWLAQGKSEGPHTRTAARKCRSTGD